MSDRVEHVDPNRLAELEAAEQPVLVDLWATWCGPCLTMAPALDEAAAQLDGEVTVVKVDIDEHPDVARRFEVMSIPTLILLSGGQVRYRGAGARGTAAIVSEVRAAL